MTEVPGMQLIVGLWAPSEFCPLNMHGGPKDKNNNIEGEFFLSLIQLFSFDFPHAKKSHLTFSFPAVMHTSH